MNKALFLFALLLITHFSYAQQNLETEFEKSNGKETATYDETITYYHSLDTSSPYVKVVEKGLTDSGKPLHLVILDLDQDFDFEKSRDKGKFILFINNGIHPGEPDGIEACKMLLRDYMADPSKQSLLKDIVIGVIPVYNIGGALNRNSHSRANQNGPVEYGFRGNARNFDLNRDFIKADTKNTRSFYEIFHEVKPDMFIDTHVSNGADYQYSITHLATQHNKMGGDLGAYIENKFTPNLEAKMKAKGSEITPYVNVFNSTPDEAGFTQFLDGARYSTGYTTLFHTLGFMIETHMLKPFDVRVKASYSFIESMIELANEQGENIQVLRKERAKFFSPGNLHPIAWKLDRSEPKQIEFKGYVGEQQESEVTGQMRLFYDVNQPFTKTIPYYNTFVPAAEVEIPFGYVIPQGWHQVIERLKLNQVPFKQLTSDSTINVEAYRIEKFNTSSSPYEGHYPHNRVEISKEKKEVSLMAGDYIFYVDQAAGRYLVETLEPEAPDSFFNWNFFDTILQQKEYFSPYVFEDVAKELLASDEALRSAFEKKKAEDKEFANSWYAQLDYIYKNSPYYESAHMQYPVFRIAP